MTKKLPLAEVERALAFYDEAISDRMEDGLSEAKAVAGLGPDVAIWAVIASLWIVDAVLVLMPFAGLASLAALAGGGMPLPGVFVLGLSLVSSGFGLVASFAVFWASRLLFRATRAFARWVASLFVRVSGTDDDNTSNRAKTHGGPSMPAAVESVPSVHDTLPEGGVHNA